ncbi:hypothetical protein J3Q64DRAFT_1885286 [Phycomyces blakesleeanus]|uniref:HotDog ACOT-type domain-containing protein n=2 Tax=Phycomyces blakesleeanus TaxID=4837 RepID=A0A162TYI1_PHYB8|nr:hypothetical protein PHYBLDRAFT_64074 [Phycomyces blakesleeanus NRRL 1555(-)]OAD70853.1 hypothetical protein PHYBLDRAFT_64074 [Phycomyces blakesleeanus NRRL 1555(-)]|eukprot:XP_018288893.1 hypothetical protein PHYBLDRAFT_64074 [Phycomyces blakesleeanus NRRL 1555(-)]
MSFGYIEKLIPFKTSSACNKEYASFDRSFNIGKLLKDIVELVQESSSNQRVQKSHGEISIPLLVGTEQIYMNIPNTAKDYKLIGHLGYTKAAFLAYFVTLEVTDKPTSINATVLKSKSGPCLGVPNPRIAAIFSVALTLRNNLKDIPVTIEHIKCTTAQDKYIFDHLERIQCSRQKATEKRDAWKEHAFDSDVMSHKLNAVPMHKKIHYPDFHNSGFKLVPNTIIESDFVARPHFFHHRSGYEGTLDGDVVQAGYEAACLAASSFISPAPFRVTKVNDIAFSLPIMLGDHIHIITKIIYSNPNGNFVTHVTVESRNPRDLAYKTAITMHVSFVSSNPSVQISMILPVTFKDRLLWHIGHEMVFQRNDYFEEFIDKVKQTENICKL